MADLSGTPSEPAADDGDITGLLEAAKRGDREAVDRLFQSVYAELRRLAHREIQSAGLHGTLNTTGLVHEAYLKLSGGSAWSVRDRAHFYATAARAMRMVLLDDARHRLREKRGAGKAAVPLDGVDVAAPDGGTAEELLALDEVLKGLESAAPELARVVEWRFYAGLSEEEIARTLEVSERTVRRQWRAARAFLYGRLGRARAAG
jgi:RNA polymerase sigma factor (TIGR02999 family)